MNIAPDVPRVLVETDRTPAWLPPWMLPVDAGVNRFGYIACVAAGGLVSLICLVVFALAAAQA